MSPEEGGGDGSEVKPNQPRLAKILTFIGHYCLHSSVQHEICQLFLSKIGHNLIDFDL